MNAVRDAVGSDFGTKTRHAVLDDLRRRARATEPGGLLTRHPLATTVAVGVACGLAFALWRERLPARLRSRRSAARNAGGAP